MRTPSLPSDVLAFFRYLGIDPRNPHEVYSLLEVLGTDSARLYELYPLWSRFCGHPFISLDTALDLVKHLNALSTVFGEREKTEIFSKNFSKTP